MTDQKTLQTRKPSFADQPHAYDPVTQPQLFAGLIGKRSMAFIVDFVIIIGLVFLLGIITLGLAWVLLPAILLVFLAYNALTIGGPKSATLGQRLMGLEVRMWSGPGFAGAPSPARGLLRNRTMFPVRFWCVLSPIPGRPVNVGIAQQSRKGRGLFLTARHGLRWPPSFH